ncbi:MAG: hypothetical protein JO019_04985 [Candidatus Kaiserbacteria bacterium]|nr:hypothetical protein [Candidatus Kaiserbacteria bacterium]
MPLWRTIDHMKTRPKDDRVAFAASIAIGVVVVLFLGWALVSLGRVRSYAVIHGTPQAASAAAAFGDQTQDSQAPAPGDQTLVTAPVPDSDASFGDQSAAQAGMQVDMSATASSTDSTDATSTDYLSQ